ncbi:unnamed protein product [Schistosoma curassoni]|uniref:Uncharacterized protein n=1 Tax=Schistosoma curassoni TaxID=6186 RepID=A0A183L833_9TREM|nr:unnamed protein product [Schistosoma mansoni]VDP83566.1 unnamed protein product [Schistosoma curassoni]|eukprot:XP_018644649.1 unnamed protein product [Schistosoma mansoni]
MDSQQNLPKQCRTIHNINGEPPVSCETFSSTWPYSLYCIPHTYRVVSETAQPEALGPKNA